MARNSFRDPGTGVLRSHGFIEAGESGDIKQIEADDFNLEPGHWQWNGSKWIAFTQPKKQRDTDREDAQAKIDDAVADNSIPKKVRDALSAMKKVLS